MIPYSWLNQVICMLLVICPIMISLNSVGTQYTQFGNCQLKKKSVHSGTHTRTYRNINDRIGDLAQTKLHTLYVPL